MAANGSQWTDRIGGYNLVQSDSGKRPVYTAAQFGGKPAFVFDAVNDSLELGSAINAIKSLSGLTMWSAGKFYEVSQDDGGTTNRLNFGHAASDFKAYGVPNASAAYASTPAFNSYQYMVFVFDGTQGTNATKMKIYVGGYQQTLAFVGTIPTTTNGSGTKFNLGNYSGLFHAMNVCEFGLVTRAITSTEVESLGIYLGPKYGKLNTYFFGDSITVGQGATTYLTSWVYLLAASKGWNPVNRAVGGSTMQTGGAAVSNLYDNRVAQIPTKTANDSHLVISLGVNDCGYTSAAYTSGNFTTQYGAVIDLAISRGWAANKIVINIGYNVNASGWALYSPGGADQTRYDTFITAASNLATAKGTQFVNLQGQYDSTTGTADGLHPNNTSHGTIATYMAAQIV